MRMIVAAKLHGIKVTGADIHYHGSITLDPEQCKMAGIFPLEYVNIWNKSNGARISTYVIYGKPGSRCCILNGAAARTCQPGDEVIIASHMYISEAAITNITPKVLTFSEGNVVDQVLSYVVNLTEDWFSFEVKNLTPEDHSTPPRLSSLMDVDRMRHDLRAQGLDEKTIADFLARHVKAA